MGCASGPAPPGQGGCEGREPGRVQVTITKRLLRLKHDHRDFGFMSARVVREGESGPGWVVRVESPSELDDFRAHLDSGTSMSLDMITSDGVRLAGEACVATLSDAYSAPTVVLLTGMGPLRMV